MGKTINQVETEPLEDLIRKGWHLLVEGLGHRGATKFIISIERGEGDSVKEIAQFWKDKTIDDIHEEIIQAKKKGLI